MLVSRKFPALSVCCSVAAVVAAVVFCLPTPADAAIGLTIQPIKISETMEPGQRQEGTILLTNASDGDVEVTVKIEDFIPVAGAEGIQFVGRAEGVTTVRDWLSVPTTTTFVFKEGEVRSMPYVIQAPEDAEPGSHFGVIFFKATEPGPGGTLKVGTQVGVLVLVTIPGEQLQKGEIREFSAPPFLMSPPVPFTIKFENTGTVYFEPKGTITIRNMLGMKVGVVPIEGQVVLPTGVKDLYFEWQGDGLFFGQYSAVATVVDGEGNELTSKEIKFFALPVKQGAFLFGGVVVLYLLFKLLRRHVRVSLR